jgi:RecA-family ATPase
MRCPWVVAFWNTEAAMKPEPDWEHMRRVSIGEENLSYDQKWRNRTNGPDPRNYQTAEEERPPPSLETFCAADLEGKPVPKRQFLVDGVIPHINVTNISGDGGIGKTILALMLGSSISSITPWLGFGTMQGPFLYFGAEDDTDELHIRLDEIRSALGLSWGDLANFHYRSFVGEDAFVASLDKGSLQPTPLLTKIETCIPDLGAIACVLDTSADVFGGDEVSRAQVRRFVALLRGVCLRTRSSIILLSHPSLSGMASGSGTSGSTAWHNSVRSRIYLTTVDGDDEARLLHFKKLNYGPKGKPLQLRWHNGIFTLDDGKASISTQVNAEIKFMQMLDAYTEQKRNVSASVGVSFAPTVFSRDATCGLTMQVMRDAMNALFAQNQIRTETFGPPSHQRSKIVRAYREE